MLGVWAPQAETHRGFPFPGSLPGTAPESPRLGQGTPGLVYLQPLRPNLPPSAAPQQVHNYCLSSRTDPQQEGQKKSGKPPPAPLPAPAPTLFLLLTVLPTYSATSPPPDARGCCWRARPTPRPLLSVHSSGLTAKESALGGHRGRCCSLWSPGCESVPPPRRSRP